MSDAMDHIEYVCGWCRQYRTEGGLWMKFRPNSPIYASLDEAESQGMISKGVCPDCTRERFGDMMEGAV